MSEIFLDRGKQMYIGKITLDGYSNYGNLLQNYALQQVLLHYAERVDTLWHTEDNFSPIHIGIGGGKRLSNIC